MSNRDLWRLVLANLSRMRARVALTAIGVIIGTAAVVVLISLGVGLQTSTTQEIGSFGDLTVITVFQGAPFGFEDPAAPADRGRDVRLDARRLKEMAAVPHVLAVTPQVSLGGPGELRLGRRLTYANLQGIDPAAAGSLGWKLATGQARLGRGQIVVGPRVFEEEAGAARVGRGPRARAAPRAAAAAPPAPPALQGRSVTLLLSKVNDEGDEIGRTERLRVAGVLEETGGQDDYTVYLSLDDVEAYNQWFTGARRNAREGYPQAIVKVDDRAHVAEVGRAVEAMGFQTFSSQDILQALNQVFLIMQAVLGGIGAIALLVAAFGIANTMTMAIYERTKEIGIMKAIGATNRDVLRIFLAEAGAIGFVGGLLGVALGWGVGQVIDIYARTQMQGPPGTPPPDTPPASIVVSPPALLVFAVAFATVIGLVSGIYPALRAASMKPLRALRTE